MWLFTKLADWWEKQKQECEEVLSSSINSLLALAGPVAGVGRGISRFVAPDPRGGICAWLSAG
jgi:mannose/fructose/N-acetylgalactosamine-specific phosphotransferase system component IID